MIIIFSHVHVTFWLGVKQCSNVQLIMLPFVFTYQQYVCYDLIKTNGIC